jgi:hypothetical protein
MLFTALGLLKFKICESASDRVENRVKFDNIAYVWLLWFGAFHLFIDLAVCDVISI